MFPLPSRDEREIFSPPSRIEPELFPSPFVLSPSTSSGQAKSKDAITISYVAASPGWGGASRVGGSLAMAIDMAAASTASTAPVRKDGT